MEREKTGIGVAVAVWKDEKILIGEDHTKGEKMVYGVPGGHWDGGETLIQAAKREVMEEAGIEIDNIHIASVYELYNEARQKWYVTIGFQASWKKGIPKNESEKTRKKWFWCDPNNLPSPMFEPDVVLIKRCLTGMIYNESDVCPGSIDLFSRGAHNFGSEFDTNVCVRDV